MAKGSKSKPSLGRVSNPNILHVLRDVLAIRTSDVRFTSSQYRDERATSCDCPIPLGAGDKP